MVNNTKSKDDKKAIRILIAYLALLSLKKPMPGERRGWGSLAKKWSCLGTLAKKCLCLEGGEGWEGGDGGP